MDIRGNSGALDSLLLQVFGNRQNPVSTSTATPTAPPVPKPNTARRQDIVSLSGQKPQNDQAGNKENFQQKQTRLVSEDIEKLDNGFRRTQEFESADGRKFSRVEEFTANENRAKRTIIQQNSSGSTTVLESVLDRQDNGTFRSTERFTDEVGAVATNIELNVTPNNIDIVLGRAPSPTLGEQNPFQPTRGTQVDLSA